MFPPFESEFVVVVADEEEGGRGAIVRGIGGVGIGEVCEGLGEEGESSGLWLWLWAWGLEEAEGRGCTCIWICMAAASLFSRTSVRSLAWSRSSQVQSVKISIPFLSPLVASMYEVCVAQPPLFRCDDTDLAYIFPPQPPHY